MEEEKKAVLNQILILLRTIGSANDAEDHGYRIDAERMRSESCESLQKLMVEHEYLSIFLPTLQAELESKRILWVSWAELSAVVEGKLKE